MTSKDQRRRARKAKQLRDSYQPDVSEMSLARVAKRLRTGISTWLEDPTQGPPTAVVDDDLDPAAVTTTLMAWLAGSREHITPEQARDAVTWLSDTMGIDTDDLTYAAGLIGHPDAPDVTFNEGVERYGGALQFTVYMILLSGALVATVAAGDPEWLRQFDLK
ncbi:MULTISPECIES: hypothetical protein [Amycolatopsis]|uniref:hypothetical protein n=1 Tax=Amycolatopsis TaxID=1813 RepID=UPI0007E28EBD|nr:MULTISPECIES: hypothetical protein [Amycolatopsis]OAP19932.1 hypothetical protein A4R44_09336 [Amycolatopsis sp. M39]